MTAITKITEMIYVGNSRSGRNENILRSYGITAVVNVARDLNNPWFDGIKTYKIGLMDGPDPDNYIGYCLAVEVCLGVLYLGPDEKLLIHCHEGRSLSVAIAVIVLSNLFGYTLEEAEDRIKKVRPEICIKDAHRPHMLTALQQLE